MRQHLQIKLLGGFDLSYDDVSLTGAMAERLQSLLTYLALNHHAPQPRSHLAFLFWSDSSDSQSRTNLRRAIHNLRRILPNLEQFITIDAKALQWRIDAPFKLDVMEFEQAIAMAEATPVADPTTIQAALKTAIALYQGKLLPTCCDEWIEPERERLHQACIRAYTWLIQLLQEQPDFRTALQYAQHLLRIDPLHEATYAALMQLYTLSGDRANALQTYHRCMTVLREELGVDPSANTRKLYERLLLEDEGAEAQMPVMQRSAHHPLMLLPIRAKSISEGPAAMRSMPPLIGREREWAMIQQWAAAGATDTLSNVLLLLGEPGIGKTRLLEELRQTTQVGQVLWGRGFAAEMVRPYGIWTDALRSRSIPETVQIPLELGVLLPEIGQSSSAPLDRGHLFDAVVQLLADWANQIPLFVILDDIQWIDEASSALLHYIIRLLGHVPVRVACIGRSGELKENSAISRVMHALRRDRRLQTLELQPFDRSQTAELIRSTQADSPFSIEVVDRVFSDSGGNPLFALEVVRALSPHPASHAENSPADKLAADNLEALIHDRLQRLDGIARELLPWAAALGRSFKPTTLAQVADYPLPQLLRAIEQLEQQTIIRSSNSRRNEVGYDFVHDIVRQVVYRQLSEPRRQLVHLQIAHKLNQHLTSDPSLVADISHHAALGSDHALAASTALVAAERCLKLFAYTEAAKLAQRGIQHSQRLDQRTRIRLHLSLLRVCAIAGVTGDGAVQLEADVQQLMGEANRLGLNDEEAMGLDTLGVLYFNQSNFTDMHPHLLRSVEVSRATSPAIAARLLASSASCLAEIGQDMVRAEALLLEAQSLAARIGLELCDIYSGLGSVQFHKGHYAEARTLLQQAWQLTQVEQDHWRGYTYLCYLAMLELEAGNPTAALPYCEEMAIVSAKIQGEGSEAAVAMSLTALANYQLQQPEADVALEQAILSLQQADAKRMLSYVLIGAAEIDLNNDRSQLAATRADAALQAAQIVNHPSEIALAWAILTQATLASGDREQAIARFQSLNGQMDRSALSVRARSTVDRTIQQMQKVTPACKASSRKSSNHV